MSTEFRVKKNKKKSQAFMDEAEGCIKKTTEAGQTFISDKRRRK
jgi:hypothetical protein